MLDKTMRIAAGNISIIRAGLDKRLNPAEFADKREALPLPKIKDVVFKENQGCLEERDEFNGDSDCGYGTSINCSECIFVVQQHTHDRRRGKRPWAKCNAD